MIHKYRPLLSFIGALTLACGFAAAAVAEDRIYAEPILASSSPYEPLEFSGVKLPVAARGFSVVELRDRQQWISGQEQFQLIFDGQIYWFAEPRDVDIFAAAPHQYAPAFGGDCIVTYVESGERRLGDLKFGLVHAGRVFFFAGARERRQFQANPSYYANGDLANNGRCVVSQVDQKKAVAGLPATVAVVNGLRYHFAGDYERRLFASDPAHYGVQRVIKQAPEEADAQAGATPISSAGDKAKKPAATSASRLPGDEEPDDQHYAMEGYCPVSIHAQGVWVRGDYQSYAEFEGKRYLLAGEKEKRLLLEDPTKYLPVLGGDCIVSKTDDDKVTAGSVYHSLIFEGTLYLFAGPEQVRAFKADPTKYVTPATPPESVESPAAPAEVETDPNGEAAEGNILREGRRSEFSRGRALR